MNEHIPKSDLYVLSNDSFMSGWGRSKNMINTCVVPVKDYIEARKVIKYIKSKSDQKCIRTVNIIANKKNVLYSNLENWRKYAGLPEW